MATLTFKRLRGAEILPWLDAIGALRITVFREYPYLYEGTLESERDYLQTYAKSPRSLIALAMDGDRTVGATTCVPMEDEGQEFQKPFLDQGYDLKNICYFGESILLPNYRGQGAGKEFFRLREAHAQTLPDMKWTAFCAVDRPEHHPHRPAGYRPLDPFWTAQGYTKHPELVATFQWKEIDEAAPSAKSLTYWMKPWK